LDPLAHLDPIGTVMILFAAFVGIGIGWGRPVPVVPGNLRRHPLVGMAITAAAGPLSNLGQAVVAAALFHAANYGFPTLPSTAVTISEGVVILSGVVAIAAGGMLFYLWYRRRAALQPSAYGDFTWKVIDPTARAPWWKDEVILKRLIRGGMAGALLFGFLAYPTGLLLVAVFVNIGLALFNLIPLGPLDGSKILRGLLFSIRARWSYDVVRFLDRIEPQSGLILFGLLMIDRWIPILSTPLLAGTELIAGLLGVL
jgi:Zn-dependent protease